MKHTVLEISSFRRQTALPPSWIRSFSAVALAWGLSSGVAIADSVYQSLGVNASALEGCVSAGADLDNAISGTTDCVKDKAVVGLLGSVVTALDQRGKTLFGEHFHIDHRLGYSSTGGIGGDLDAVFPINTFTSVAGNRVTRALFLQNGVSTWTDEHGYKRNDMRVGMVHRIAVSEQPDAGVFGTSVFFQENIEREHGRMVLGLDYTDQWGRGAVRYFMRTTDWRSGRLGYQERAREGMELELRTQVTDAIDLRTATGYWESKDDAEDWTARTRFGVGWQPHTWLGLQGRWEDIGTEDDSWGVHAVVAIPFGGKHTPPGQWRGLGSMNLEPGVSNSGAIWDSVDSIGRIETIEREAPEQEEEDDLLSEVPQPAFNQLTTGESDEQ